MQDGLPYFRTVQVLVGNLLVQLHLQIDLLAGRKRRIGAALSKNKAIILQNHGLLTVGGSVDEAVWWFLTMERTCKAQLLAEAAGTPIKIAETHARLTHTQVGSNVAGWFQFQPLYARIVGEQPDLLT